MKKKQPKWLTLSIVAGIAVLLVAIVLFACLQKEKMPQDYTWADFEALSPEEQLVFPDRFENMEEFNDWLNRVQGNATEAAGTGPVKTEPVDTAPIPTIVLGDKDPSDFTWEDYQALTPDQQMVFPDAFDSMESFHAWMNRVQPNGPTKESPPDSLNMDLAEKKPEDYTWEDYLALSMEQQMLFPDYFERYEDFEVWWKKTAPNGSQIN